MAQHPIVFVDLETGGTDPEQHQITQIGAFPTDGFPNFAPLDDGIDIKIQLVKGHFTQEALKVQGWTPERWRDSVPVGDAMESLKRYLEPYKHERRSKRTGRMYQVAHMGAFNGDFDAGFLRATCDRADFWMPLTNWTGGVFDVMHLAKWALAAGGMMVPESLKLEDLCKLFGIEIGGHDALGDARATAELAKAVMPETQPARMPFTAGRFGP